MKYQVACVYAVGAGGWIVDNLTINPFKTDEVWHKHENPEAVAVVMSVHVFFFRRRL